MYITNIQSHRTKPIKWLWLLGAVTLVTGLVAALVILNTPLNPVTLPAAGQFEALQLPIPFIPNAGQTDTAVAFQAHDMGGTLFFTEEGVILSLPQNKDGINPVVKMQFAGANPTEIRGETPLPGTVNYIQGDNPTHWYTDLPTYQTIVYEQIYPGIDLTYDGVYGRLKGTFTVRPGADPGQIRWQHVGATAVTTQTNGDLVITLPGSETVIEKAPLAWQTSNGQRQIIPVSYTINQGTVNFTLGQYDPTRPLTIDPTLIYSATFGGSSYEDVEGIAVDADGNIYLTGTTNSTNFPTENPYQGSKHGDDSAYVTKINPEGSSIIYSTFIGGSEDDEGNDIAVTSDGKATIAGVSDSSNFPTANAPQSNNRGVDDAFILQLNSSGNGLVFSTYLGGGGMDEADSIALDNQGNVYVTGYTASANFPTHQAWDSTFNGATDAFVTKLNPSGTAWVYSTFLGGSSTDSGASIAVDSAGSAYVAGETNSGNFPTHNPYQASNHGSQDLFITKLNSAGSALTYSTFLGGSSGDYNYDLGVTAAGQAVLVGNTDSNNFPTHNPIQASNAGLSDAYVTTLAADGQSLTFSTYLGGANADKAYGLALDGNDIYVTGDTFSVNFPVQNPLQSLSAGEADAFIAKLSGTSLVYSTYLGTGGSDHGVDVAADGAGNAYVAGLTAEASSFPESSMLGGSTGGVIDVFVVKVNDEGDNTLPPIPGSNLAGSRKAASRQQLGPGEEVTFTIRLHNSGTDGTAVTVTDALPEELTYVNGSVTGGGVYSAASRTLTWTNIPVASGEDVELSFAATAVTVTEPTLVLNTAVIDPDDADPIERSAGVLLTPELPEGDVIPPHLTSVQIGDQDVLTDPQVTLHIEATDNVAVTEMYIKEWALDKNQTPHWTVVNSSGWIPYEAHHAWTLTNVPGVHYVTVWVRDAAKNTSVIWSGGMAFASLVLPSHTIAQHEAVPYLVQYDAGENVTVTLTPSEGDADLYVWYPHSFAGPDEKSTNGGTAVDSVSFTAPTSGAYLIIVYGYTDTTYALDITPGGGPVMTANPPDGIYQVNKTELTYEPLLSYSGLDPLGTAVSPANATTIFLPIVVKNP